MKIEEIFAKVEALGKQVTALAEAKTDQERATISNELASTGKAFIEVAKKGGFDEAVKAEIASQVEGGELIPKSEHEAKLAEVKTQAEAA